MAALARSNSSVDCSVLYRGDRKNLQIKRDDILTKKSGEPRWIRSQSKHKIDKEYYNCAKSIKDKNGKRSCEKMIFVKFGDENTIKITKGDHGCELNNGEGEESIADAYHIKIEKLPDIRLGVSVPPSRYE
ncbi:hypothetical protein Mgra_00006911 [Meloidogyne graminicola]|uniref:Uncharacterized protein n=1 Tax=Meloidogyne graminicola TaxID=189291 RepID=A0A8S9ZK37_9BILA|nr:hypothetical protein Mgra_00006911 [Meloidogyne graminicola]